MSIKNDVLALRLRVHNAYGLNSFKGTLQDPLCNTRSHQRYMDARLEGLKRFPELRGAAEALDAIALRHLSEAEELLQEGDENEARRELNRAALIIETSATLNEKLEEL